MAKDNTTSDYFHPEKSDNTETKQKLTKWKNEPSLDMLKSDFEAAKSANSSILAKITHWNDIVNISGSVKIPQVDGRSKVQPRLARKQLEWRVPALSEPFLANYKIFNVQPRTFEDKDAAKQNELLLNYQFDTKINKTKFIDDYIRTAAMDGTVIVKVGWEKLTITKTREETVFNHIPLDSLAMTNNPEYVAMAEQTAQQIQEAIQLSETNPRMYEEQIDESIKASVDYYKEHGQITLAQPAGTEQVKYEENLVNNPTIEIQNPANIFPDPGCNGDFNKALFLVRTFVTNRAELKKDGNYINLDLLDDDINSDIDSSSDYTSNQQSHFNFSDLTRKRLVAYEYWGYYDIYDNNTLVPIVVTWIGDTIIRIEESPYPDKKLPFVFVPYLSVRNSLYGEPDASILEDNQSILGAITRGMIDLLGKSANAQQGMAKGFLDPYNKDRFEKGLNYEFNPVMPVNTGIFQHTFPEIPQTAIILAQMQQQEAESQTGVKAFSGGISGESYGKVAAGIRGALDASSKREMAILRRMAKGIIEIGNKIIALNSEFLSEDEVIRVTNSQFIPINREDLKGNFDLLVDISTPEIDNSKAQDLGFMLQTIGPNLDIKIMLGILAEIADLKQMPDLAESLRQYEPQPDPMEEQRKQLELQKLQSEIQLNQARAAHSQANAENTNMDTQLEASGVKHQQELQRQQAQAQGNKDLEIIKAITKPHKPDEIPADIDAAYGVSQLTNPLRN